MNRGRDAHVPGYEDEDENENEAFQAYEDYLRFLRFLRDIITVSGTLLPAGTWASRPRKKSVGCLCAHISVICLTASRVFLSPGKRGK